MDTMFLLGESDRAAFLRHMVQSLGCTYICLWSHLPFPSNCLLFLDGVYKEESSSSSQLPMMLQPSSSSGSLARRLLNAYCGSLNYVDHGCVPGIAFKNNLPYMEMKLDSLQRLASSQVQLQFYQEAGIKTVVLIGCTAGEIELGFSSEPLVDLEMEIKNWFPVDFSRQTVPRHSIIQNQPSPSSSSSSLGSISVDSIEYSPSVLLQETLVRSSVPFSEQMISCNRSTIPGLSQIRNIQFPTIEPSEDAAAMTKSVLAVLYSPSTSSSINNPTRQYPSSAFKTYNHAVLAATTQKQNLFRRVILFYRNLNMRRSQDQRPTTTQLHHMISERRRRKNLNESFHVLRSLLPPVSKKDKASILSSTTEYLSLLKCKVEQLSKINNILETQLSKTQRETKEIQGVASSIERVNVEIANVSPSTSEARFLDLRVGLRSGDKCSLFDLVIHILEFLKQQRNLSLLSIQSNTRIMVESTQVYGLVLRLKVEEDEFDESAFQEAVRRVVDGLPLLHSPIS